MEMQEKMELSSKISKNLSKFNEIKKIVIFGSYFRSKKPNDIDIAIIQDSKSDFLFLSLKYRKELRYIAKKIEMDILPIKESANGLFLDEINKGIVIYEKRD